MKKWLTVIGIVFAAEVLAETSRLMLQYVLLKEVTRTDIVAFLALFISVSVLVHREI